MKALMNLFEFKLSLTKKVWSVRANADWNSNNFLCTMQLLKGFVSMQHEERQRFQNVMMSLRADHSVNVMSLSVSFCLYVFAVAEWLHSVTAEHLFVRPPFVMHFFIASDRLCGLLDSRWKEMDSEFHADNNPWSLM